MLNVKTFICNMLQENTYIVSDETRECVIIDCGAFYEEEQKAIIQYIDTQGLKPVHLLATHGHFDHNFGNDAIYKAYGIKVEMDAEDESLVDDIPGQFESMVGMSLNRSYPGIGRFFGPDETIRFGNHELKVLKTPGHSRGGVVFYCQQENIVFTGDTLFRMSIGRTDFEGGSYQQMMDSLKNVLAKMPAETTVYSGHGPKTTIGDELRYNPYLH